MSEMVERVADALWKAARCPGNFATGPLGGQQRFREMALAAIEATREPSDAMVAAGDKIDATAREVWQAMIDAALRD